MRSPVSDHRIVDVGIWKSERELLYPDFFSCRQRNVFRLGERSVKIEIIEVRFLDDGPPNFIGGQKLLVLRIRHIVFRRFLSFEKGHDDEHRHDDGRPREHDAQHFSPVEIILSAQHWLLVSPFHSFGRQELAALLCAVRLLILAVIFFFLLMFLVSHGQRTPL